MKSERDLPLLLAVLGLSGCAALIGFDDYEVGPSGTGGSSTACNPGATRICYDGPAGTQGVGICRAGIQTCNSEGTDFGLCQNQTTPATEDCSTPLDDDCDGQINQPAAGCVCTPGTTSTCYDGPPGTLGVSQCKAGTMTCSDDGKAYGPCMGQSLPSAEACDTPTLDENCDGVPSCIGLYQWGHGFGDMSFQSAHGVAVDASGAIILVGEVEGAVDFGGGPLMGGAGRDAFVAKYDIGGNHLWSRRFGGDANQAALSVALDENGEIVIAGRAEGTIDFGGGPLTSAGAGDAFVARFDPAGNHLWSKIFGDKAEQSATSIAIDPSGEITIVGRAEGTIDFGGGPLTSAGAGDAFIARFDAAGNPLWSRIFGNAAAQRANAVATSPMGKIIVVGESEGIVDFGGGPLAAGGGKDLFVVQLSRLGDHEWSHVFGDIDEQTAHSVAVDSGSQVVVVGETAGVVNFGGADLTSSSGTDVFIAQFNSVGGHMWSKIAGNVGNQAAMAVAIDDARNIVVVGSAIGNITFGGTTLSAGASAKVFATKLGPTGNYLWARISSGSGVHTPSAAAMGRGGEEIFAGSYWGTLNWGAASMTTTSAMDQDAFLIKLTP